MRGDVDRDLAGHHVTGFPVRDELAHRVGGPADDGRVRGCEHRHHHIGDPASAEFVAHLLGGQLDRCHRAAAGEPAHEARPAADDPDPVRRRQRPGDHSRCGFAHRMADDGPRCHAVGLHRGGQRHLHGEQRRLYPVDTGDRLRGRHRFGDRKPGLGGDQRLEFGDTCGECGFACQQVGAHRRPLGTLSGEHPHRSAVVVTDRRGMGDLGRGNLPQARDQLRKVGRQDSCAHRPVPAPARQRVRQIRCGEVLPVRLHPPGQPLCRRAQPLVGGGRHREQECSGRAP